MGAAMNKRKNPATATRDKVQTIKAVGAAIEGLNRTVSKLANQLEVLGRTTSEQQLLPGLTGAKKSSLGRRKVKRNQTRYISFVVEDDPDPVVATGRVAWCLKELLMAGDFGITGFRGRGPRVASYIHTLRKRYGLEIETEMEPHGGRYPGSHARYFLWTEIKVLRVRGPRR